MNPKTHALLQHHKRAIFIDTESGTDGQFSGESEDVTKNLFKFCCAIMNFRPK